MQEGEATAKPSPPTGFTQSDLRHGVTSAFVWGRRAHLQLLLVTAQRAAATPKTVISSRGLVVPKCIPTYLSAIRSPGNRDQIERHFKLGNACTGVGLVLGMVAKQWLINHQMAESNSLHDGDATQTLIGRNRMQQEPTETEKNSFFNWKAVISLDRILSPQLYPLHFPEANASQQCVLLPPEFKGWDVNTGSKKAWTSVACRGRNSFPQSYLSCFYELLLHSCKRYGLRYLWCIQFCYHWFIERNQPRDMMEGP